MPKSLVERIEAEVDQRIRQENEDSIRRIQARLTPQEEYELEHEMLMRQPTIWIGCTTSTYGPM